MMRFLVLVAVWFLACGTGHADEMAFSFAPGDGTRVVETRKTTITKDFGLLGREKETLETTTQFVYRRSPSGYSIEKTLTELAKTVDGRQDKDLLYGLLVNCQYIVDKKSCQYIVDNGFF